MSLKEEIERRRMAQSANGNDNAAKHEPTKEPCANNAAPLAAPLFLRIVKLTKQCWVLPWASFHGIGYTPGVATENDTSKHERLHMVFMRHEVTVRGYNLVGVVDAIEATALRELCETSEKYTDDMRPDAATPVVLAVEINVKTQ